jgi:hypothetical protein
MSEVVQEREAKQQRGQANSEVPFGVESGGPTAVEIRERRAAVEKLRTEKERPRQEFLLKGEGDSREYFDVESNAAVLESLRDQSNAPKSFEEYTPSERAKFLLDGELIPAKEKPAKKEDKAATPEELRAAEALEAPKRPKMKDFRLEDGSGVDQEAYEKALDKYEADKAAFDKTTKANGEQKIDAQIDREIFDEIAPRKDGKAWWDSPEHTDAFQSFPRRLAEGRQALTAEENNVINTSAAMSMPISTELQGFLGHALARVKNPAIAYLELAKDAGIVKRMNEDWVKSANNPKARFATEQAIRYVLATMSKGNARAGGAANGNGTSNGAGRKSFEITKAGKPPVEVGGSSAAPEDAAEAALRRGDGEEYRRIQNDREREQIRARRGRRGRR